MATLNDHVSVTISLAAFTPSRVSFSVPLIIGFHNRFPQIVKTYSSIQEMSEDGFTAEDAEYQVAAKVFSQNPTVAQIKVGRLTGGQTARVMTLLPVAVNETLYRVSVNGVPYSFTSDASATAAEISTGLAAAINAGSQPVTASVSSNNLVITADVVGPDFSISVADSSLWSSIQDTSAVRSSLSSDLVAISQADGNFYAVLMTRNNAADINLVSQWVQANNRILVANAVNFGSIVAAENCLASNTTNLLAVLNTALRTRTFAIFTKNDGDYPAAALVGAILWRIPGSYTAKFKSLLSVSPDFLSTSERLNVEQRSGNHYQTVAGVPIVSTGVMSAGAPFYLDTVILIDWIEARIKEEVFATFTFNEKIPFTDAGISIIGSAVRKVLGAAEENGGIEQGWSVFLPKNANISAIDKSQRFLEGVRFDCKEAGAIHSVAISGRVSP
jgi:hypothetical protein